MRGPDGELDVRVGSHYLLGAMNRFLPRLLNFATLLLLAGVGVTLAVSHPRFQFGTLVGDDAGYYLAIARNFCLGHGFSFDRVSPTNGFNPLMPMLLIQLDRLTAPAYDLVACFRIATLTTWVIVVLGLRPLQTLADRVLAESGFPSQHRGFAVAALLFMYAGFLALKGYYGMDAFLVLTIGLAYLARVAERGLLSPGLVFALADGSLLGLAVLARIDSLPLAVAAFAVMVLRRRDEPGAWRAILARALPFTLIVAAYLGWNRIGFGDWLPISARLKSAFPHLDPAASLRTVLHSSLNRVDQLALFAALAAAILWLLAALKSFRDQPAHAPAGAGGARDAMLILALYLAGRLGWLLAFSRLDVQGSYFMLAHPFIALVALVFAGRFLGARGAALTASGVVVVTLALAAGKWATALPSVSAIAAGRGDEWAAARRIHDAVGDHDVIFGEALGLIGYAADRPWINGDGVANSRAYQDAIRAHALTAYLSRAGVTHVVLAASPARPLPSAPFAWAVPSHLYGISDTLGLDPAGITLREGLRRSGGTELWLIRWAGGPRDSGGPGLQGAPGTRRSASPSAR